MTNKIQNLAMSIFVGRHQETNFTGCLRISKMEAGVSFGKLRICDRTQSLQCFTLFDSACNQHYRANQTLLWFRKSVHSLTLGNTSPLFLTGGNNTLNWSWIFDLATYVANMNSETLNNQENFCFFVISDLQAQTDKNGHMI